VFKRHLAAVYGRHYRRARRRWALCPGAEVIPQPGGTPAIGDAFRLIG
jgi:hypothetical protein